MPLICEALTDLIYFLCFYSTICRQYSLSIIYAILLEQIFFNVIIFDADYYIDNKVKALAMDAWA